MKRMKPWSHFLFINIVNFSCPSFKAYCIYSISKIIQDCFPCFTRSLHSLVSYRVRHSKRISIATCIILYLVTSNGGKLYHKPGVVLSSSASQVRVKLSYFCFFCSLFSFCILVWFLCQNDALGSRDKSWLCFCLVWMKLVGVAKR